MGRTCTISKNLQHTNSLRLSCAVFPSLGRLLNQQVQCDWNSVASQHSLFLSSISYKDVFETFKPKWKSQNQVSSAEVSSNIRPDQLGLFHFPLFKLCAFCIFFFFIVDDDPLKSYDWQWDKVLLQNTFTMRLWHLCPIFYWFFQRTMNEWTMNTFLKHVLLHHSRLHEKDQSWNFEKFYFFLFFFFALFLTTIKTAQNT